MIMIIMYISAISNGPPSRHTELISRPPWSNAVDGDWPLVHPAVHHHGRDYEIGSVSLPCQHQDNSGLRVNDDRARLCPTAWTKWSHAVYNSVDRVGEFIAITLGIEDHDLDQDVDEDDLLGGSSFRSSQNGLNTWAESSIYVEVCMQVFHDSV